MEIVQCTLYGMKSDKTG